MTLQILFTILLAAVFHSIWNIAAKESKHNETLLWLQMIAACCILIPIFIVNGDLPPAKAWPTLIASGILQAVYYLFLARCYKIGNLSIVYPLVRGSAPVFVCIFSALLGLEHITVPMFFALLLTVFGIYVVNMPTFTLQCLTEPFRVICKDKSTRLSILIGFIIAAYTLVDKQNVRYCSPLTTYTLICAIPALILAPYMIKKHEIKSELSGYGWLRVLFVSLFTFLAYYLVLVAMSQTNASYVSSIREVSVVFVSVYTAVRTRDSHWQTKIIGSVIIFCGIFLMAYL